MSELSDTLGRRQVFALAGAVVAGTATGAQAQEVDTQFRSAFEHEGDLANSRVAKEVDLIWLSGRVRSGIGAGSYARHDGRPSLLPILKSSDGARWRLVPSERLDVCQFGAIGNGREDDTSAIQRAIDCAVYTVGVPRTVFFPGGVYRIGRSLHIGYGFSFVTVALLGETLPAANGNEVVNSLLLCDFNNSPGLNIQGGRRVHINSLTLRGSNYVYLTSQYDKLVDRTMRDRWFGPKVDASSDSPSAPYCGICVDGYAGPQPVDAYPDFPKPSFVPPGPLYGKNFSSHIFIEDCQISGFCVGVMVQPGNVPIASNGDFLNLRDCDISWNLTGVALGNADARCNNISNCRLHFNYTSLDSVNYGSGRGSFQGHVAGCSFDNNVHLMQIDAAGHLPQSNAGPSFLNCYGESLYSLGTFVADDAPLARAIAFYQCRFQFSVKNEEYSPAYILKGRKGVALLENCIFSGGFGLVTFDCGVELRNFSTEQPVAGGALQLNTESGRAAYSFTCGVIARYASYVSIRPGEVVSFTRSIAESLPGYLRSDRFPVAVRTGEGWEPVPIPWWAEIVCDGEQAISISPPESIQLPKAVLRVTARQDIAEFDVLIDARSANQYIDMISIIDAGDLIRDEETTAMYFVSSRTEDGSDLKDIRLKLKPLTGLRTSDSGRSFQTNNAIGLKGDMTFLQARRFYPSRKIARISGSENSNTLELRDRLQSKPPSEMMILARDTIGTEILGDGLRTAEVQSIDLSTGQVTLSKRLEASVDGWCPPFTRRLIRN